MDSKRIITGLIILGIIIIAIGLLKAVSFLKGRRIVRSLYMFAQKNNEVIREYDQWNNSAIGLTGTGKRIFMVSNGKGDLKSKQVDLVLYKKCSIINDVVKAPHKDGSPETSNSISLELSDEKGSMEQLFFYNSKEDGMLLTDELQFAEKWCRLVNEQLGQSATWTTN